MLRSAPPLTLVLFTTAVGFGACDCEGGGLSTLTPDLRATPTAVDFDTVPLGLSASADVRLENVGTAPLRLDALRLEGPDLELVAPPTTPLSLEPSAGTTVTVRFTASSLQPSTGALIVDSNDPDTPSLRVPIVARRRQGPVLVVCVDSAEIPLAQQCGSAPPIPFGDVRPGEYREARVVLRSEGTDPVVISAAALSGGNVGAFSVVGTATASLAPGTQRTVRVRMTPTGDGALASTLALTTNDGARALALSGAGASGALCVSPALVDFGAVLPGNAVTRSISISNCGQGDVVVDSIALVSGADGVSFTTTVTPPLTLPPIQGLSLAVGLRWAPTSSTARLEGRLRVGSPQGSAVISLRGRASQGCELSAVPSSLTIDLRQTLEATGVVTNVGSEVCTITSIAVTDNDETFDVTQARALPFDLRPGDVAPLTVGIGGRLGDSAIGVLTVSTADRSLPIPLRASFDDAPQPCDLTVSPTTLAFGDVTVGRRRTLGFTLSSPGPCVVSAVALTPGSDPAFQLDTVVTGTIPAGARASASVRFSPTQESGVVTGIVRITSNDADTPVVEVSLSGFAGGPALCVEPAAIDFGSVATEATSSFQLIACGTRSVQITALTWSTPDAELELVGAPALPLSLAPGNTRAVVVRYRPTDTQNDTAILTVSSDDVTRPSLDVRLTGGTPIVPVSAGRFLYMWRIDLVGPDQSEVARMPLQGAQTVETFWGPRVQKPCAGCHTLSPDGRYVAVVELGGTDSLQIVDTLTKQVTPVPGEARAALYFSWNPRVDTTPPYQYVYASNGDLHISSLLDGYLGKLVGADTPDYDETMPSWGSDGRIVFTRFGAGAAGGIGASGRGQLMVVAAGGGSATALSSANDTTSRYYPSISRDGRWVAHTTSAEAATTISARDARIELIATDGSGTVLTLPQVNAGDGGSSYPQWSLDGRYLSFSSNRSGGAGSWDVYYATAHTLTGTVGVPQLVPGANSAGFEHAAQWSP